MSMDISFKLDPEIIIGPDTLSLAGSICGRYGRRVMIAADHALETRHVKRLQDILEDSGISVIVFDGVEENSSVEMAENIVELCCAAHCSAVVGFGGRKAMTIARMAAYMSPLRLSVFDLFDRSQTRNQFLPFIAIPTSGMDAFMFTEYFAVVDPRDRLVKSVSTPHGMFAAAIVDSNLSNLLTDSSAALSLFEGFGAAAEAYCSAKANFLSDALLERSLSMYAKLIKFDPSHAASGGIDQEMSAQANFAAALGISLSSPGIAAALPLAVNSRCPSAAKPQIAAALLPFLAERLAASRPEKMARIASFLGGSDSLDATTADAAGSAAETIRRSMETLGVKTSLKDYNIPLDMLMAAVESARNLEFVSNSPWIVSEETIFEILKQII